MITKYDLIGVAVSGVALGCVIGFIIGVKTTTIPVTTAVAEVGTVFSSYNSNGVPTADRGVVFERGDMSHFVITNPDIYDRFHTGGWAVIRYRFQFLDAHPYPYQK